MLLQNGNIILRKLEPSDLPFLYAMENDSEAWNCSDTHNPLSQQDLRDYLTTTTGDIYLDKQLRLIVQDRQGETLGAVDLYDFDAHNAKAALGIYLKPVARGNGVGTQAVSLLLEYASSFLHLRQVYALVACSNLHSINLFERIGFRRSATLLAWFNREDALLFQYIF
ncbi:MAG TPA: GNAT family N-acetyltransferase [Bacteroidales bacterium]|nr:GNAT family N-acetyltransferase [Bacteroidales bacterium]